MSIRNKFHYGFWLVSTIALASPAPDILQGNSTIRSGRPTLVFEAGGGDGPETWLPLVPYSKDWGALFLYKRAGYGNSPQGAFPRTGRQIASELHAHLKHINLKPPYVLVGHSAGGLFIRVFQQMYPNEVSGMVFIDPYKITSVPCLKLRDDFFRRKGSYPCTREFCELPKGAPQPFQSELDHLDATVREVSELPQPKNIPIVYLSANQPSPKGVDPNFWDELMKELAEMGKDIATQMNATFRQVDSGHYIHHDHPKIVAGAIAEVMKRAVP